MLDKTGEHNFRQFSVLIRGSVQIFSSEFVEFVDFLKHFVLVVIVFGVQSVLEDSLALVDEALSDLDRFSTEVFGFAHQHALNHSRDVSQVKDLVEFACSRREFRVKHDTLEDLVDGNDQRFGHAFDFRIEFLEVIKQDSEVDSNHRVVGRVVHSNGGEEALCSV